VRLRNQSGRWEEPGSTVSGYGRSGTSCVGSPVALTIDVGITPDEAKALLIRGVATIDIVDGVPDEYLAQANKGMSERLGAEGLAEYDSMSAAQNLQRLRRHLRFA
jgi:hypothetical protein